MMKQLCALHEYKWGKFFKLVQKLFFLQKIFKIASIQLLNIMKQSRHTYNPRTSLLRVSMGFSLLGVRRMKQYKNFVDTLSNVSWHVLGQHSQKETPRMAKAIAAFTARRIGKANSRA